MQERGLESIKGRVQFLIIGLGKASLRGSI